MRRREAAELLVITTSEMQTHRACPWLHGQKYIELRRPIRRGRNFALGSIMHAGIAEGTLAGHEAASDKVARAVATGAGVVNRGLGEYLRGLLELGDVEEYLEEEACQTAEMLAWMIANYFDETKRDFDELRVVELERPFEVPVLDVMGRPRRLQFAGVRDGVYYHEPTNALHLHEHKTCTGDPRAIDRRLELDPQSAGYIYALWWQVRRGLLKFPDGTEVPRDAVVGRVDYNVLRKAMPKAPKVNKNGLVSHAAIDTTPELYRQALQQQGKPVTEKQADRLQHLENNPARYFYRSSYDRSPAEIEQWRADTYIEGRRIRQSRRDPAHRTRNPGHCTMAWSPKCSFRGLCLDPHAPEILADFETIDSAHPEVEEAKRQQEG